MNYTVTPDAVLNLATGNCEVLRETCSSPGAAATGVRSCTLNR